MYQTRNIWTAYVCKVRPHWELSTMKILTTGHHVVRSLIIDISSLANVFLAMVAHFNHASTLSCARSHPSCVHGQLAIYLQRKRSVRKRRSLKKTLIFYLFLMLNMVLYLIFLILLCSFSNIKTITHKLLVCCLHQGINVVMYIWFMCNLWRLRSVWFSNQWRIQPSHWEIIHISQQKTDSLLCLKVR